MTDNELKFLIKQWGQQLTTEVITDVATNITKQPNDSIVLAVAIKHLNKRIDDLITTLKILQSRETVSGFDAVMLPQETPST